MPFLPTNSLDYQSEVDALNRRREIAAKLMQMQTPQQGMYGGVAARFSPLSAVASALSAGLGKRQLDDLDEQQRGLLAQQRQAQNEASANLGNSMTPQPDNSPDAGTTGPPQQTRMTMPDPSTFYQAMTSAQQTGVSPAIIDMTARRWAQQRVIEDYLRSKNGGAGAPQTPAGMVGQTQTNAAAPSAGGGAVSAASQTTAAPVQAGGGSQNGAHPGAFTDLPAGLDVAYVSGDPGLKALADKTLEYNKDAVRLSRGLAYDRDGNLIGGLTPSGVSVHRDASGNLQGSNIPGLPEAQAIQAYANASGAGFGTAQTTPGTFQRGGQTVSVPNTAVVGQPPAWMTGNLPGAQQPPNVPRGTLPQNPIPPQVQAGRDASRMDILQQELAQQQQQVQSGQRPQVDPALQQEIAQMQRSGAGNTSAHAGGYDPYSAGNAAGGSMGTQQQPPPPQGFASRDVTTQGAQTANVASIYKNTVDPLRNQLYTAKQHMDIADATFAAAPQTGTGEAMRVGLGEMLTGFGLDPTKVHLPDPAKPQMFMGATGNLLRTMQLNLPGGATPEQGNALAQTFASLSNEPEANDFLRAFNAAGARRVMTATQFVDGYLKNTQGDPTDLTTAMTKEPWFQQSIMDDPVMQRWAPKYHAELQRATGQPGIATTMPGNAPGQVPMTAQRPIPLSAVPKTAKTLHFDARGQLVGFQ